LDLPQVKIAFSGYALWSYQKMGRILRGQPFILTFFQFFYILLKMEEMLLPSKILRMNPGQTENEKAPASVLPETDVL
jgi:hypothetical protein